MRDRGAEHRHDGIADVLLERAAVALKLAPDEIEVRLQAAVDVLRVHALRRRRRPDDVGENRRDQPPLFARRLLSGERRPTREAELSDRRIFLGATRTNRHVNECR